MDNPMNHPPPHSLGGPGKVVYLTGMFCPYVRGRPLFLNMFGVDPKVLYMPLFQDVSQLRSFLTEAGLEYDSIKQVQDGGEFLDSIPKEIEVITNLYFTPEKRIRFTQLHRDAEN